MACPLCDNDYEASKRMENGSWTLGKVSHADGEIEYICADWDADKATVYLHTEEQVQ